ncbi:MAG: phosphocholine cytidylyltransferase family protein [Bacteroidetes bacterium]|nr:phosphocholine cytidylyltransferase family protein [Bacteroidota bacterium]MBU1117268.1 phosphocholine cytidylyltransferase family protein [Bacteroidota bacterium]MBU1800074.1 phosphocholine cytidylyltransferase family protein [Bacteroidota bacterium]
MKAVILAAGVASRLRPLTNNTPKCLLKVGDKSILERTIDNLVKNNISEIIVVTGFLREMIEDFLTQNYPKLKFTFIFNEKYDSTNNIFSLWLAKSEMLGYEMLLMDSDIIFDSRIIGQLVSSKYENNLALRSDKNMGEEEIKCLLNDDGSIKEIGKHINPLAAIGESIGIEKFSKELVFSLYTILDRKILDEKAVNIFYEAAFQDAMNSGAKIFPVDVAMYKCMEIDTIEDFEIAAQVVETMM